VINQYGLCPARTNSQIAPLNINKDLDKLGLLNEVTTFNFHRHLPHYAVTTSDTKSAHVLTRQPIDLERASVYRSRQYGVQLVHLDAAR